MKNRREHRVPLSQQALATLEELHKVTGHSQWLMPGRLEDKPASQNTMIFAVYRMGFHKRTTVHGFRALASTILNEAVTEVDGNKHRMWSVDAVERALAHTEQNKVKGAYDRGDRFEERTRLMQWWADYLDAVTEANQAREPLPLLPYEKPAETLMLKTTTLDELIFCGGAEHCQQQL